MASYVGAGSPQGHSDGSAESPVRARDKCILALQPKHIAVHRLTLIRLAQGSSRGAERMDQKQRDKVGRDEKGNYVAAGSLQHVDSLPAYAPFGLIRSLTCDPHPVQIRLVEIPAGYSRRQTAGPPPRDELPSPTEKRFGGPERKRSGDTHWASAPRRRRAPR